MTVANVNVTKVLFKRGNTVQNNNYTGVSGEITIDTQAKTLRIHDGSTVGGNIITATLTGNAGSQQAAIDSLNANVGAYQIYANANATTQTVSINAINANLGAFQTVSNANAAAQATSINSVNANVGAYQTFANSNAASQTTEINSLRANITAANAAITSLQSNASVQAALLDTLTGNAATQSTVLDTLTANAASQATTLTSLLSNAISQETSLISLLGNAATQSSLIESKANLSGAVFTGNIAANNIMASNKIETESFIRVGPAHDQGQTWANPAALFFGNTTNNPGPIGYGRYYQINLQNVDPQGSGDICVTADDGNDASHYMSMGINNTAWNDPYYPMGLPNDGYLFMTGGNLQIVSDTHNVEFLVGNIATPQMVLTQANVLRLSPGVSIQFGDNTVQTSAYTGYGNTNVQSYLAAFNGNIIPAANVTYSLGDSTHQWKDLWVSNNTIYIGNTPIRVDGGTLLVNGAPVTGGAASSLVNGASTFQLFANGESRSPDTVFASNGVSIINANGAIQGGIYNSGDADWFNIGASTGRGIKFYVDEETDGPLFFANGSANVPNNLYSSAGVIGDVSMYGGTISGTNPGWNYLTLANQIEGSVFVQLPSEATASVANLRIHNDIGNVELATGDGFIYNYWYFRSDGNLIIPGNINYANGTSILSGLGGAITGNISVDDSAIQFVANSSGDGYGLSTIRLVPYTQGYESAIIIIDPTYPNHIHIRAGFEQDNAEANLFLGGEASHFNVEEGANPNVSIRSNYYTWTFDNTGTMIVPDGSAIRPMDSNAAVGGSLTIRAGDSVYEDSGSMTIRAGDTIGAGGAVDAGSMVIRAGTNVTGTGGQAQLEAGSTINGNAGDLLLYSGQTVTGAGGNVAILAGTTVTGDAGSVNIESGEAVSGDSGNITITARGTTTGNAGSISLTAGSATTGPGGSLLFTAGSTVGGDGGDIILVSGDNVHSGSPGVIRLRTVNAAVNQDWIFDNGNLTFPSGGNVTFDASAVSTIDGVTNISATGTIGANVIQVLSDLTSFGASPAPVIYGFRSISTTGSAVNEGNISASGNLVASQNAYVTGNVFAARYNFANGSSILNNLASQSYVDTQITNLVNNAPALLDTLGEIAANLATEANTVGSILNSISNTNANVTAANVNITNLESNAASQQTSINTLLGRVDQAVNLTSSPQFAGLTTTANVNLTANVRIHENLVVDGNINFIGNVTQTNITTANAVFTGDSSGFGALYAGVIGYTPLPYTVIQATADYNDYSQINFQNLNLSANASTEWVATAGNGTDLTNYIDFGIAGGAWDGTQLNSVGTAAKANDGWLYVQGNAIAGTGGNLVIGTIQSGKRVNILTGGPGSGNIYSYFTSSGLTTANVSATNYLYANGVSILTGIGGTYSNTNVEAYIGGNIGSFQIFANANAATQATSINSINANIGSYQIFANANAATQATSINTINANLGSYQAYANATFGVSTYSNTNVAAYLTSYTGNIAANHVIVSNTISAISITTSGTGGNITGANVISANTFVFAANGVNILTAASGSGTDDVLRANVGAYQIFANANAATQATSINTINANLGAYQTFANANVSSIQNQIFASNANIGAFQTYANATFGVSSYGNTQVAAYLLTYPNTNVATLNTTSGNIVTLRTANFNSANAVISGGYISALTNASIISATVTTINSTSGNVTTLAATNLSTANAVVTGGYASGLANISVTGNATVGNLVGSSPNTTIISGAYSSTFDNVGNVVLPNLYVSGNTTAMGIAAGYAPNRPAFRVYGSGSPVWYNTANVNIKGSSLTVDYNQGNYFDTTTGKFTAPIPGLYQTTLVARVGSNNGLNQIAILKNGNSSGANIIAFWETDTNTGTASHFGTSGVVKLAAGDFLSANILAGNVNFDGNDSWTVTYIG